jgi:uncharacterized protein with HEPN domain
LPSSRPWVRLEDILENGEAVLEYTQGFSLQQYLADRKTSDACERCLSRISEAAVKLGAFAEERLPAHNWVGMRRLGNVLRHDYDQIETPNIWDVITLHLPPLIADVRNLLATERPTES